MTTRKRLRTTPTSSNQYRRLRPYLSWPGLFWLLAITAANAADGTAASGSEPLAAFDEELQAIHKALLELDRDLSLAEEQLFFPADARVTVFLSLDTDRQFALRSVQLKLDDVVVASERYGPDELNALERGGAQRLYLGSLRRGGHTLTLLFSGTTPDGQEYRRGATVRLDKARGGRVVEFQIRDPEHRQKPVAQAKIWQ